MQDAAGGPVRERRAAHDLRSRRRGGRWPQGRASRVALFPFRRGAAAAGCCAACCRRSPALALVALVVGLLVGGGAGGAERATAKRFATLWAQRRLRPHVPAARRRGEGAHLVPGRSPPPTATPPRPRRCARWSSGSVGDRSGDAIPVHLTVRTRVFGTVHGVLELPVSGEGDTMRVAWRESAVFPGLRGGEQLARATTSMPPRAALLARDGSVLASGDDRTSDDPEVAGRDRRPARDRPARAGCVAARARLPARRARRRVGARARLPARARGPPGRHARRSATASSARTQPQCRRSRAHDDRPGDRARGDRRAGRPLRRRRGDRSAHGRAAGARRRRLLGAPAAGLDVQDRHAHRHARVARRERGDARSRSWTRRRCRACGWRTPAASTAAARSSTRSRTPATPSSRRSARDSARRRLVDVAERFGFNEAQPIPGAETSTIPNAEAIGDDLAVGSTAIGQGLVQATTLQMTLVAATIAMRAAGRSRRCGSASDRASCASRGRAWRARWRA